MGWRQARSWRPRGGLRCGPQDQDEVLDCQELVGTHVGRSWLHHDGEGAGCFEEEQEARAQRLRHRQGGIIPSGVSLCLLCTEEPQSTFEMNIPLSSIFRFATPHQNSFRCESTFWSVKPSHQVGRSAPPWVVCLSKRITPR